MSCVGQPGLGVLEGSVAHAARTYGVDVDVLRKLHDREQTRTLPEAAPVRHTYYLWLFNRQKTFLREEVIEASAPLTEEELSKRYAQLRERLADELWPAKIAWIEWSQAPRTGSR